MVLLISLTKWGRGRLTFWDGITEFFCVVGIVSTDSHDLLSAPVSTELEWVYLSTSLDKVGHVDSECRVQLF
jgi:hypothetical protein